MTDILNEQLSALVDGELPDDQVALLLARMEREPELRRRWASYHLIGDALRGHLPERIDSGLADRVAAALADEPAPVPGRGGLPRWLQPVAGAAIAATVAVVAILAVHGLHRTGGPAPVALNQAVPPPVVRRVVARPGANPLSAYLVNHNEYAVTAGMPAVVPYVRIVSYGGR